MAMTFLLVARFSKTFMFFLPILYSWPMKNFWTELNVVLCYKLWYLPDFIKVHEPFEQRPPPCPWGSGGGFMVSCAKQCETWRFHMAWTLTAPGALSELKPAQEQSKALLKHAGTWAKFNFTKSGPSCPVIALSLTWRKSILWLLWR